MGDTARWIGAPPDVAERPADGSIRPRPTWAHPRILNVRTEEADRQVYVIRRAPIGVVTAFVGAPFFAVLLWAGARRR